MGAGGAVRLLALVLLAADISEQKMSQQQRESVTQQAHFKLLRRHLDVPSHQPFGFSSGLALEAEAPQPLPPEPAWVAVQLLMDDLDEEDENNEAGDMVKHVRAKQEKRRKASRREVSDKMAPWRGPYGKLIDFIDI